MPHTGDVCLATAVTDSFVPGAVVMLGSFRDPHPGFAGDVVVLHDGLSEAPRTVLAAVGGRVRFEPVRSALLDRVAGLAAAYPGRLHAPAMFNTLDAFRLDGYRKVLFCDSDVLFQGPVEELFDTGAALLCCGDRPCLLGRVRDAETLAPIARTIIETYVEPPRVSRRAIASPSASPEARYLGNLRLTSDANQTHRDFRAIVPESCAGSWGHGSWAMAGAGMKPPAAPS